MSTTPILEAHLNIVIWQFNPLWALAKRIRIGQVLIVKKPNVTVHSCVISSKRQDKVTVESRTSKRIIFHTYWEDEKLAYFASPTTRTHEYSWRKSDFYLWPVRRRLHNRPKWNQDRSVRNRNSRRSLPNQRPRRFSCWYSSLFITARALSYINLAGVLGVRYLEERKRELPLLYLGSELDPEPWYLLSRRVYT